MNTLPPESFAATTSENPSSDGIGSRTSPLSSPPTRRPWPVTAGLFFLTLDGGSSFLAQGSGPLYAWYVR
jgi:hypothetical protein